MKYLFAFICFIGLGCSGYGNIVYHGVVKEAICGGEYAHCRIVDEADQRYTVWGLVLPGDQFYCKDEGCDGIVCRAGTP